MKKKDKSVLLNLARESIGSELEKKQLQINPVSISKPLKQKQGSFVTLTMDQKLRGCIGHIMAIQKLYQDVIENAHAAAFEDPRFMPLTMREFEKIDVEISVLGRSTKLEYDSPPSLIKHLEENKPGVILKQGIRTATFLPQVWEEIQDPEKFLCHLSLKAGLDPYEWTRGVDIETYTAEKITEKYR